VRKTTPLTGDRWLRFAEFAAGNEINPRSIYVLWKSGRVERRGRRNSYEYRWIDGDPVPPEPEQIEAPEPTARVMYDPEKDKYLASGPGLAFVGQLGRRVREIVRPLAESIDYPPDLPIAERLPPLDIPPADAGLVVYIGLTDIHFGHGDPAELGQFIDDRITEALGPILRGWGRPAHIVIPVGSDAMHVDTYLRTTTRGTEVYGDTARAGYDHAAHFYARTVDRLRTVATDCVHLVYCAGNHDRLLSHALMRMMEGRYLGAADVRCHSHPDRVKGADHTQLRIGRTLWHVEHGDRKGPSMLSVMARSPHWSECSARFALTGHRHHFRAADDDGGFFHVQCRAAATHTEYEYSKCYGDGRGVTVLCANMHGGIEYLRP
jgi:hypothetical protein